MRILKVFLLVLSVSAGGWLYSIGADGRTGLLHLVTGTPHQRYAARLRYTAAGRTPAAREWLESARYSLEQAAVESLPSAPGVRLDDRAAVAFGVSLRRGERLVVEVKESEAGAEDVFVDLFRREGTRFEPVAAAEEHQARLDVDVRRDGDYVVRAQRRLASADARRQIGTTVTMAAKPSLRLPVKNATRSSIQSMFGAGRDGGRRQHHGVDIFASRGTPVIAASSGIVSGVGTNGLGGNVVWITRPGHRESHYYAHLDRSLVTLGEVVSAGDVIGTVGNTGNARTTSPHLHFGIYSAAGAVDPLPYIAPRAISRRRS